LATKLLNDSDENILLWLHATNEEEFITKTSELPENGRVGFAWGELKDDAPFASVDPNNVTKVIHTAAVTRFNVEEDLAQQVNVEGATKAMEFSRACPNLDRFSLISTIYASGLKSGPIQESIPEERPKFANFYEQSKYEAEQELVTQYDDLPWNIIRVATIIADDDSGQVTQYNAFHNTLKLLFYGLLSLVPGNPEIPIYLVKGDFIANGIFSLLEKEGVYHLCDTKENSITLGQLIDTAFGEFETSEDFKERRILKPLYSDEESFEMLVDGLDSFAGEVVNQSVKSVAPFASQLFIQKEFMNDNMRTACPWHKPEDMGTLIKTTCAELVKTKWGRKSD
jgi:nucleoside-diphosphate-sugar epimerase